MKDKKNDNKIMNDEFPVVRLTFRHLIGQILGVNITLGK